MEFLNHIWGVIAPYLAGISVGGILTAVLYGCLKGAFSKTISKINVEKIAEQATNKGIDKVKEVSFKHSIQPVVNSELNKITEKANDYIDIEINKLNDRYEKIINILSKLSAYFDTSIFVSEEAKAELKEAIADARIEPEVVESVTEIEIKPEEIKTETLKTKVER